MDRHAQPGEAVQLFGWDESWRWRQCLEPRPGKNQWLQVMKSWNCWISKSYIYISITRSL